jgi:hypothetical protein
MKSTVVWRKDVEGEDRDVKCDLRYWKCMKRPKANRSNWPEFDSPVLQAVAEAFQRRRKALRYQAKLSCEREFSEMPTGTFERIIFDLKPRNGKLRLSVWEDGEMCISLCVRGDSRKGAWAFADQFHGGIHDVSPATLLAMVEATLADPFQPGVSDIVEYRESLRRIWKRVRTDKGTHLDSP